MKTASRYKCSWQACRDRDFASAKQLGWQELDSASLSTQFDGYVGLAFAHSQELEFDEAIEHFKDALFIADSVPAQNQARLWLVHGLLQRELGEHNIAIHLFENYFQKVAPSENSAELAFVHELLGMGFIRMGRDGEAHEAWAEARRYESRLGRGARTARLFGWHGLAHLQMGHWSEAAESFRQCRDSATEPNLDMKLVYAEAGLAAALAKLEDPKNHITPLRRAALLAEAKLQTRYESYYLRYLADTLMAAGEQDEAVEAYLRASEVSLRALLFQRARYCFQAVLAHYDALGNREAGLEFHRQYVHLDQRIQKIQMAHREISLQLLESIREWRRKTSEDLVEL